MEPTNQPGAARANTWREDYLEWGDYFMAVASLASQRSRDPKTQVGACIVNQENDIVGVGYNRMPKGCDDDVMPWGGLANDPWDTKYPYVCYAVSNAIMNKNNADLKGCTIHVTLFPSNECAKLIIQAGLKEVVFLTDQYHHTRMMTASKKLFDFAGIKYRKFEPKKTTITIDFTVNDGPGNLDVPTV